MTTLNVGLGAMDALSCSGPKSQAQGTCSNPRTVTELPVASTSCVPRARRTSRWDPRERRPVSKRIWPLARLNATQSDLPAALPSRKTWKTPAAGPRTPRTRASDPLKENANDAGRCATTDEPLRTQVRLRRTARLSPEVATVAGFARNRSPATNGPTEMFAARGDRASDPLSVRFSNTTPSTVRPRSKPSIWEGSSPDPV